ncbi:hypothetical protein EDB85DRAFT_1454579 [Lactarius pseudohatsudake]|nr:hypothetical protein EDB85DRAFT_1454579 [Lactarius pseudohatsudake]
MSSMMLTCPAGARARLTKRVTISNDKLPEDVLLEIFDAYRQDMELEPCYENIWNGRNGWLGLAHVCQSWRCAVLLSSSRLHLHLPFNVNKSRLAMLRHLPPFPILINYRASSWTVKKDNLALSLIRHRSRVRGITLRRPYTNIEKFFTALSYPFPELESLEICPPNSRGRALVLPATLLWGSAQCLQRLTLREVAPGCLSPLLSSATSLVELALTLRVAHIARPEASLLTNLQRMSCLRRLELNVVEWPHINPACAYPPASAGDVVPLSKLTHLLFSGHRLYLQELVVGLAAPSLQQLDAELCGYSYYGFPGPIPHLCKFICDTECQFTTVRLGLSYTKFRFYACTGPQSVDEPPFRITRPKPVSLEEMGQELSGPLSTVEELIVAWDVEQWHTEGHIQTNQWRGFCYHVPQVKVIRVSAKLALDVAHSFQQEGGEPIPNLLPALQRVEVLSVASRDDLICDTFEPLITARQRAGRPVRLSWTLVEE